LLACPPAALPPQGRKEDWVAPLEPPPVRTLLHLQEPPPAAPGRISLAGGCPDPPPSDPRHRRGRPGRAPPSTDSRPPPPTAPASGVEELRDEGWSLQRGAACTCSSPRARPAAAALLCRRGAPNRALSGRQVKPPPLMHRQACMHTGEVAAVGAPLPPSSRQTSPLLRRARAHGPHAPLAKCIGGERRCIFTSPLTSKGKLHRQLPRLLERASVVHSTNWRGKNGFASAVGVSLSGPRNPIPYINQLQKL
jgi:hypothetical protein